MDDHADAVLKSKKDSSMAVGFNLLKNGEGDAFVSAGNSGALCMGATLAVKDLKELNDLHSLPLCRPQTVSLCLLTAVQM